MTNEVDPIVDRLRERRQELRWGQRELAKRAGVQQSMVSDWETGTVGITLTTLRKLARAMGLDISVVPAGWAHVRADLRQVSEHTASCPCRGIEAGDSVTLCINFPPDNQRF